MSEPVIFTVTGHRIGVYHLLRRGKLIYIGQTVNIWARIGAHQRRFRFDRVEFFPCEKGKLLRLEAEHIRRHLPPQNGAGLPPDCALMKKRRRSRAMKRAMERRRAKKITASLMGREL